MKDRSGSNSANERGVQVIIPDPQAEIELQGQALLTFQAGPPGTRVLCTGGTLWLTQAGDLHDHLIQAGQSFSLYREGVVLAQGLPWGKVLILDPARETIHDGNLIP